MKIGVFDSGLGGLTLLKALKKKLGKYDFVYLADSARAPYGNKTPEQVLNFTKSGIDFLFSKKCQLIILACNTASALALRKIQKKYLPVEHPRGRVLGVVVPNIELIIGNLKKRYGKKQLRIGLIATRSTVKSRVYEKELAKINKSIKIFFEACPELVPLIEKEAGCDDKIYKALKKYLEPLKKKKIKTLILGCTHYPLIKKQIMEIAGRDIKVIDTSGQIAQKTEDYLKRHDEINSLLTKKDRLEFYTTGDLKRFKSFINKYLQIKTRAIKKAEY